MLKIALMTLLTVAPSLCLALEPFHPGTDEYLIFAGLTEEQLTTKVNTENREPFISARGETSITDPTGDVLSRTGTHPEINYGWGDLIATSLSKNNEEQCWLFVLQAAEDFPSSVSWQANFLLYIDSDNNLDNNALEGVRANTDYEISIKFSTSDESKKDWYADLRWYNPTTDFWATNKTTASTLKFKEDQLSVCVPFDEISAEITPTWRTAAAVSDGENTQIDVAPGTGFPPPKGQTYLTWKTSTNEASLLNWQALGIVIGIAVLLGLIKIVFWFVEKKKKAGIV